MEHRTGPAFGGGNPADRRRTVSRCRGGATALRTRQKRAEVPAQVQRERRRARIGAQGEHAHLGGPPEPLVLVINHDGAVGGYAEQLEDLQVGGGLGLGRVRA